MVGYGAIVKKLAPTPRLSRQKLTRCRLTPPGAGLTELAIMMKYRRAYSHDTLAWIP